MAWPPARPMFGSFALVALALTLVSVGGPRPQTGEPDAYLGISMATGTASCPAPTSPQAVTPHSDATARAGTSTAQSGTVTAPSASMPAGIDVSHWNGVPNYDAATAAGVRFSFSKATQGLTMDDWTYAANAASARQHGLTTGPYHFFNYWADGVAQADHLIDFVDANGGFDGGLPPVIDVECLSGFGVSNHAYASEQLHAMAGEIYRRIGRMPIIYTSRFEWNRVTGGDRSFGTYPLWVACWACGARPLLPSGWSNWQFWQTGMQPIPGMNGSIDEDVFNGTAQALVGLRSRPRVVDGGAAYASSPDATVRLNRWDGKQLRFSTDGGIDWSTWQVVPGGVQSIPVTLDPENGPQTVKVQLRDPLGNRSPVWSDGIVLDTTPPVLTKPVTRLATGGLGADGSAVPLITTWTASDTTSGLSSSALVQTCGITKQTTQGVALPSATATWASLQAGSAGRCTLVVSAIDGAGLSAGPLDAHFRVHEAQETPTFSLRYSGPWHGVAGKPFEGGRLRWASRAGTSATYRFIGSDVGLVSALGPNRGRAAILIDGVYLTTIDLYAPATAYRQLVFAHHFLTPGAHGITVRLLGTHAAASRGNRVDLDAFLTLTQ